MKPEPVDFKSTGTRGAAQELCTAWLPCQLVPLSPCQLIQIYKK